MDKKNGLTEGKTTQETRPDYSKISKAGLTRQPLRAAEFIFLHPGALTHEISARCAIGNVSDACCRANRLLENVGLRLVCRPPNPPIRNRFGEPSPVHEWQLVSLGGE